MVVQHNGSNGNQNNCSIGGNRSRPSHSHRAQERRRRIEQRVEEYAHKHPAFAGYPIEGTVEKAKRKELHGKHPEISQSLSVIRPRNEKSGICHKAQMNPKAREEIR